MTRPGTPAIGGGRLRGLRLEVPPGEATRPTASRVREAMFNVLGSRVQGARVLDLYAGSGALGLEALSRGARHVLFVERDARALAALRRNLAAARVGPEAAAVIAADCARFEPPPDARWDLVLADPPYALFDPVPPAVCRAPPLAPGAQLLLERAAARIAPLQLHGLRLVLQREHGQSAFALYALAELTETP